MFVPLSVGVCVSDTLIMSSDCTLMVMRTFNSIPHLHLHIVWRSRRWQKTTPTDSKVDCLVGRQAGASKCKRGTQYRLKYIQVCRGHLRAATGKREGREASALKDMMQFNWVESSNRDYHFRESISDSFLATLLLILPFISIIESQKHISSCLLLVIAAG